MVDLMPTMLELAGITNTVKDRADWEGTSFAGMLRDPRAVGFKNSTFSQFQRCGQPTKGYPFKITDPCTAKSEGNSQPQKFTFMGHSIRTEQYRYTLWFAWDQKNLVCEWDKQVGEELYDHTGDMEPDIDSSFEQDNRAADPSLARVK